MYYITNYSRHFQSQSLHVSNIKTQHERYMHFCVFQSQKIMIKFRNEFYFKSIVVLIWSISVNHNPDFILSFQF